MRVSVKDIRKKFLGKAWRIWNAPRLAWIGALTICLLGAAISRYSIYYVDAVGIYNGFISEKAWYLTEMSRYLAFATKIGLAGLTFEAVLHMTYRRLLSIKLQEPLSIKETRSEIRYRLSLLAGKDTPEAMAGREKLEAQLAQSRTLIADEKKDRLLASVKAPLDEAMSQLPIWEAHEPKSYLRTVDIDQRISIAQNNFLTLLLSNDPDVAIARENITHLMYRLRRLRDQIETAQIVELAIDKLPETEGVIEAKKQTKRPTSLQTY